MIGFDSLTLFAWYEENREFIKGARIQKIQQPDRRSLIFVLRKQGRSEKLYINIDTLFYHVCFMNPENECLREFSYAKQPPMFCMLLRKYLEGALISDVKVFDGERVLEIMTEKFDELSSVVTLTLAIELMGKYSNVILYNSETKTIIGAAHNVGEDKSQKRQIIGGLQYSYPELQNKKFIEAVGFQNFLNTLRGSDRNLHETIALNYSNITIFSAHYLAEKTIKNYDELSAFSTAQISDLYEELVKYSTLKNYTPMIDKEKNVYILAQEDSSKTKFGNVNEMIDEYYAFNYSQNRISAEKKNLVSKLNKEMAKYDRQNKKLSGYAKDEEELSELKLKGDLIMGHLYDSQFNTDKISLKNFANDEMVEIDYDTSLQPVENAQKYYKQYAKAKKAAEINEELIKANEDKKALIRDYIFSIESAETFAELSEVKEELYPEAKKQKSKKEECTVPAVKINDFVVYTGRNNRQNDYIYSKLSAPNDLWFHVLNQPGAHILIKVPKNRQVNNNTLLECARLAKKLSSAASSGKTSVIYTKRQFIKRPPNTQAGYVTFRNETEIVV